MNYSDLVGKPFKVHGRDSDGYDCYGLVKEVYRRNGIDLPDIPYRDLDAKGDTRNSLAESFVKIDGCAPLCIVEMEDRGTPSHCAVYIGDGRIIHAVYKYGVVIEPLYKYMKKITGYYRHA